MNTDSATLVFVAAVEDEAGGAHLMKDTEAHRYAMELVNLGLLWKTPASKDYDEFTLTEQGRKEYEKLTAI